TGVHEGAAPGVYVIFARGSTSGRLASATLRVTGPPSAARLVLSTDTVADGDSYSANASGFAPGEPVRFSWNSRDKPAKDGYLITARTSDGNGSASIQVHEGAAPDRYVIFARGANSGRLASAMLQVIG